MRKPRFSILLVLKNALPLVTGTLQSLKHQTFEDFEVVVADGASTDGTLDVLHEAANELPLRILSEPDRSLSEGLDKALRRATGEIAGMLCADERYYPNTLEYVSKWFEANPEAVTCSTKLDFIDQHGRIIGSHLPAPFNLEAHLACEIVLPILTSFFNRSLIGDDFRYDREVPTCPDYEYWARLGFRFSAARFEHCDVSLAQAYRTRDSMSFRTESFRRFCRDKLTHLNNVLAKYYTAQDVERVRCRSAAGIHMWAAEQLNSIEPGHRDILAHCAEAARYDKTYDRIAQLVAAVGGARYDASTGIVRRNVLGPRTATLGQFQHQPPPPYWTGSAILSHAPLTLATSSAPWGYSLQLSVTTPPAASGRTKAGQCWARVELEVIEGCVGISIFSSDKGPRGEGLFSQTDGRSLALIPIAALPDQDISLMVRSGGYPSAVVRIYRADLLSDPDPNSGVVPSIELTATD